MDDFKQTMIADMFKILSNDKISKASKEHILDMYCWILTERIEGNGDKSKNAKFKGCVYWSKDALKRLNENIDGKKNYESGLRHEHVVPRSLFRAYVREIFGENWCNHSIDENIIKSAIDRIYKYFIGCVVTADEAKRLDKDYKDCMPDNIEFKNISSESLLWSRYIKNHIVVNKIEWKFEKNRWEHKLIKEDILNIKEAKK